MVYNMYYKPNNHSEFRACFKKVDNKNDLANEDDLDTDDNHGNKDDHNNNYNTRIIDCVHPRPPSRLGVRNL